MSKLEQAWDLFMANDFAGARSLVEADFDLQTCREFSFLNLMGYLYLQEKQEESAITVFEKYLQIAQELGDKEQEHTGLHQLAMAYREMGDFRKALQLIDEEESIISTHFKGDELKLAINYYEQGYLRLKLQLLEEALTYMTQSLGYAKKTDDLTAQACSYRGLGEIYKVMKQNDLATSHFQEAISLFIRLGDEVGKREVEDLLSTC